jgi:hypothetical protein
MKNREIIDLGTKLGLPFKVETNYPSQLNKNIVIFDGCNGQRFLIDGDWDDDRIYQAMGNSLILMGRRQKAMQIHKVLSITNDNEDV